MPNGTTSTRLAQRRVGGVRVGGRSGRAASSAPSQRSRCRSLAQTNASPHLERDAQRQLVELAPSGVRPRGRGVRRAPAARSSTARRGRRRRRVSERASASIVGDRQALRDDRVAALRAPRHAAGVPRVVDARSRTPSAPRSVSKGTTSVTSCLAARARARSRGSGSRARPCSTRRGRSRRRGRDAHTAARASNRSKSVAARRQLSAARRRISRQLRAQRRERAGDRAADAAAAAAASPARTRAAAGRRQALEREAHQVVVRRRAPPRRDGSPSSPRRRGAGRARPGT